MLNDIFTAAGYIILGGLIGMGLLSLLIISGREDDRDDY